MSLLAERKQATYQPLIDEYETTENKLNELRTRINAIDPYWAPATLADKILTFITDKGGKNVDEKTILEQFKTVQAGYVKNTLKKGVDTRWTVKEQKYSSVTK